MRDFNHTVGVLVTAYLKDTLRHTNCAACAVGNIVADAIGCTFFINRHGDLWWREASPDWFDIIWLDRDGTGHPEHYPQAEATGYSNKELFNIERAFERAKTGPTDDIDGYKGLMAVVDVLADIHGIDIQQKEEAKALFVKH